jgi:hypothetical protein
MEAIYSSETSFDFQRTTRRYIPEDSTLHNHRCENLKSCPQSILFPQCMRSSFTFIRNNRQNSSFVYFNFCSLTHHAWRQKVLNWMIEPQLDSRYDRRSVGQSVLVSSPIWGSWPDINYCLTVTVLSISGAPSDETISGRTENELYRVSSFGEKRPNIFRYVVSDYVMQ